MFDFVLMIILFWMTGIGTGILSVMFGAGGGMVIVPVMYWIEIWLGIPHQFLMHIAVGTSLAVMVIAIINTVIMYTRSGNIYWNIVWRMLPFVALGAIAGSYSSRYIDSEWLRYFFIAFLAYTIWFAWHRRAQFLTQQDKSDFRQPSMKQFVFMGTVIGLVSVWLGIGGSAKSIQFFRRARMPMLNASATAAALIPAIAIFGAVGYTLAGLHATGLPPYTFGYIYEPAFFGLTIGTFFGVPIGKRLVTKLSDSTLSKYYLLFLVAIIVTMSV